MQGRIQTPPLLDRYDGERLLLTGVTGFLGRALLEKMLRALPTIDRVYVLIRPRGQVSAAERLEQEVFGTSIFQALPTPSGGFDDDVRSKVVPVEGDLSSDHFGLNDVAYRELAHEVTLIVNCGAACSFRQPLDQALHVNLLGTKRILRLAKDAGNIPLCHISTCYVHGTRDGHNPEEVLPPGHTIRTLLDGSEPRFDLEVRVAEMLDACEKTRSKITRGDRDDELMASAESALLGEALLRRRQAFADRVLGRMGTHIAEQHGWTDVYLFTKSLAEQQLVAERGEVPLSIVRPSIIESSYAEPFPGWIDGLRMSDPLIAEAGKGNMTEFGGRADTVLDLIPCDMVANAILAAVPARGATKHCRVYQVASSPVNPLTLGAMAVAVNDAFRAKPVHLGDGSPVKTEPVRWIDPERFLQTLARRGQRLLLLRDLYALIGLKRKARRLGVKLRLLSRLRDFAELYGFYTSHSPTFEIDNTLELMRSLTPDDRKMFPFDAAAIDWHEYFVERHIPGLRRSSRRLMVTDTAESGDERPVEDVRRRISA